MIPGLEDDLLWAAQYLDGCADGETVLIELELTDQQVRDLRLVTTLLSVDADTFALAATVGRLREMAEPYASLAG